MEIEFVGRLHTLMFCIVALAVFVVGIFHVFGYVRHEYKRVFGTAFSDLEPTRDPPERLDITSPHL